jgi:hypothetical protein
MATNQPSARGDLIAERLKTATPTEAVELLCEALDWAYVYLPPKTPAGRALEEFRSVIGARFPMIEGSPILSREAAVNIAAAARGALRG